MFFRWKILHNGEFYDLHCPPNIIRGNKSRKMRWAGHVARTGTAELYKVKPDGKKAKGDTIVQEDNIEMDLQKLWPAEREID